ncbi:hypothetical protein RHGRI_027908 [Rhododendron griersonianum]|uniref:Uncharacterized protein n=1 Tax=Rhododendron griersonianum TaxID=479676 RepID=A0AAV6J271_9ERIC|nr:hypothetical protein RHGRI_027908 [Rhododendron griersonianum]
MGGGGQAMKRIPRIKFPQRHPKPPASGSSQIQAAEKEWDAQWTMSDVPAAPINTAVGGKASLQPKRTPVSEREIDAILPPEPFHGHHCAEKMFELLPVYKTSCKNP